MSSNSPLNVALFMASEKSFLLVHAKLERSILFLSIKSSQNNLVDLQL